MRIRTAFFTTLLATFFAASAHSNPIPKQVTMSRTELLDKIRGGWAGQVLGCTYGGPTEFKYRGKMIDPSVEIAWEDSTHMQVVNMMKSWPTLYDDIYMDLTFVGVFDRLGVDAPQDSLAYAFANEEYHLWHANQVARYNLLRGIKAPESGHWRNNPHADDIDYQIEADFAGLMTPGMPNSASEISDRVGHIMNYGDGWYGGVYMGAMYSLAFICDDVETIVTEALKTIPSRSKFHRCMADVIDLYHTYPDDWRKTWEIVEQRWGTSDVGCSEGALAPLNIDAVINSAYVVIGLLYGEGDFTKTIDISTRCGQDSDCNPASAAGILATMLGYSNIPEEWLKPLQKAEDMEFLYIPYDLQKTYEMSFMQAQQMIVRGGGKVTDSTVTIKCQKPKAVKYEVCFPNLKPTERKPIHTKMGDAPLTFTADCAAIIFNGYVKGPRDYVAELEMRVDGGKPERLTMPALYRLRNLDVYWNFELKPANHTFELRWLNPMEGTSLNVVDAVLFQRQR